MSQHTYRSLVIVGSGPAALTAAIYAARAGHSPVVYAGTTQPGGDLTTTTDVDNFPGFPEGIQGPELVARIQQQAERFGATVVYDDVVAVDVARQQLTLGSGELISYDAVIWATGSEHRKLGLDGEDFLSGSGVSYCATCDGLFFSDEDVAVVGGGDSAMEEALFLSKYATTVTLLVRGPQPRASKAMVDRVLATENITVRYGVSAVALYDEDSGLAGVVVRDEAGKDELVEVTGLFVAIGSDPRTELVAGQVPLDDDGYIVTRGRSSLVSDGEHIVPGFFAAGDVIDPVYRQAIVAAGSGAAAGIDASNYLDELAG